MPDEAQKLIAEVLARHFYGPGWDSLTQFGRDAEIAEHYAHLAAEIDAALGGLRPKVRYRAVGPDDAHTPCWEIRREEAEMAIEWFPDDYSEIETQRRWVSGWTEVRP